MEVHGVVTPILRSGDDFAAILAASTLLRSGDVVVVSSKAVATCEGAAIDLSTISPTAQAVKWSKKCGQTPEFRQAVLNETARMHGWVGGSCPHAMFTYLQPDGFGTGALLSANAGLDLSNVEKGYAIGWPIDPVTSTRRLAAAIAEKSGKHVAVVMGDSCCMPARLGVIAFALTACGIEPLVNHMGSADLFGKTFRMTREAVADQLCIAANFVMGNTGQRTPAAIVRGHGLPASDFCGWVPGIEPEEDLFRDMLWKTKDDTED